MTGLLATQAAAIAHHVLIDVLIAHCGLCIVDAQLVEGFVKAEIGHHRGDHRVVQEFAALLHMLTINIKDMVAGEHIALFIHAEAAVTVAVEGKAHIQALFHHKFPEAFNMGGAGVFVDVAAIRFRVDHIGLGSQSIKHAFCHVPGRTVGAIQAHFHTLKRVQSQADQVTDITVAARHIVHSAADIPARCQRNGVQLAVQIIFHQGDDLRVHLLARTGEKLDAIVIIRIMGGGDHDAAVKAIGSGHIGNRRGGGDVKQAGFRTGCGNAAGQGVLKHITGPPGVFADDDPGRTFLTVLLSEVSVVPAQEAAYLKSMIHRQGHIGFTTETVRSEIFTHYRSSFFTKTPPAFQICSPGTTPRTQDVG